MISDRHIREAVWGVARAILHHSRLERKEPPAHQRIEHHLKVVAAAHQIIAANKQLEHVFEQARRDAYELAESLDRAIDGFPVAS